MKSMHFKPAFVFRFRDSLKAAAIFFGVMVAVFAGMLLLLSFAGSSTHDSVSGSLMAYGFSACIMAFVCGIVTVREDLRMMNQFGVSRRTTFAAEIASGVLIVLTLAAAGELLCAVSQALAGQRLYVNDLYGVLYVGYSETLNIWQHLSSLLFNSALMLVASAFGRLLSLLIYRLPKPWKAIVAVGVPMLAVWGLPIGAMAFPEGLRGLMQFLIASFWNLFGFLFVVAAVLSLLNYLLLRRAPVRAAK